MRRSLLCSGILLSTASRLAWRWHRREKQMVSQPTFYYFHIAQRPPRLSCSTGQAWVMDLSPQAIYPKSPDHRRQTMVWLNTQGQMRACQQVFGGNPTRMGRAESLSGPQPTASFKWVPLPHAVSSVIWLLVYAEDQESIPSSVLPLTEWSHQVPRSHGGDQTFPSVTKWHSDSWMTPPWEQTSKTNSVF